MEKTYAYIKQNYVIDRVSVDLDLYPDFFYPFSHDFVVEDIHNNVNPGDWYEASEGIFYRPLSTPPDLVTKE
jgi:hypothetical protein